MSCPQYYYTSTTIKKHQLYRKDINTNGPLTTNRPICCITEVRQCKLCPMLYYGNTITHPSTFCIIECIPSNHLVWIYGNVNNPLFCFTGLQQYKAFSLLYHGST